MAIDDRNYKTDHRRLENFCKTYGVIGHVTREHTTRAEPPRYNYNSDINNYYLNTYQVPVVSLKMPEDMLEKMIYILEDFQELERRYGPRLNEIIDHSLRAVDEDLRLSSIRKNNPGVQLAWEKYQMMLKIAGGI